MWQQWINVVLGLWVIEIPFSGITGVSLMWTLVITGIVIAGLAIWGAVREQSEAHQRKLRHT